MVVLCGGCVGEDGCCGRWYCSLYEVEASALYLHTHIRMRSRCRRDVTCSDSVCAGDVVLSSDLNTVVVEMTNVSGDCGEAPYDLERAFCLTQFIRTARG